MGKRGGDWPGPLLWLVDFEDFDLVAIGISDEGHFALAGGEFFAPSVRPDFDALFLEISAIVDNVENTNAGVHEIFGDRDLVIG